MSMNVNQVFEETAYSKTNGEKAVGKTKQYITDHAAHVADVGYATERHNRYMTVDIDATHPADDTTSVTWTSTENVRRYRVYFKSATATDLVKVVEDAVNGSQADSWLTETNGLTTDSMWWLQAVNEWSEWKEFSKDPDDVSLTRLDFELFTGGTGPITETIVEAE